MLLKVLGEGQFGVVYKACLINNKEDIYAIKCIQKSKL